MDAKEAGDLIRNLEYTRSRYCRRSKPEQEDLAMEKVTD